MLEYEILTLNSIHSICNRRVAQELNDDFCYQKEYWIKKRFKKERVVRTVRMIQSTEAEVHWIHTGLVERALEILERRGIEYSYESKISEVECDEPYIKGVTFRPYQAEAIEKVFEFNRGVIHHSTGTGKSIVLAGIMSAFSQEKILFLVHTQDLVTQMKTDLLKFFGVKNVGEYTGKTKNIKRITVATIQSFYKVCEEYKLYWDVVICDECHHVNQEEGMYGKVLQTLEAPVKIGTTATLPASEEGKMWLEALIGPVIHTYDINQAGRDNTLAIPDIEIVPTYAVPPYLLFNQDELITYDDKGEEKKPTSYRTVYWNGIVRNLPRNQLILHKAEQEVKKGRTVLIMVVNQQHGKDLIELSSDFDIDPVFVYGHTKKEKREEIKKSLKNEKLKCAVASVVWIEGLDIPSLGCVINAASGKSEIKVLQAIGRGLRKTENKDTVKIIDFDDSKIHTYLGNHFKKRNKIYTDMGWLTKDSDEKE